MSLYAIAVFLHIVGALGLFAALGLEWASLLNLRRATAAGQAREWARVLASLRTVAAPAVVTLLVTGIYLTATRWGRCAVVKPVATVELPCFSWFWLATCLKRLR